jgi:threonine/homoserine/homoserine lactone efflux protein
MQSWWSYSAFILVCVGMVMTPGPNMIYLVSRTLAQGSRAGFVSLIGVVGGFLCYMIAAAVGLSALFLAVPYAYDAVRLSGVAYLLYLAFKTATSKGSPLVAQNSLEIDGPRKLLAMGFLTSILNPKVAVMYLSLLPQFVDPNMGHTLLQSLFLGLSQIIVSILGNTFWILTSGSLSLFFIRHPSFVTVQRWVMATLLAGVALRIATEARR